MAKTSMIIYESTFQAIQFLPDEKLQLEALKCLLNFGFYDIEPKSDNPFVNMILVQAMPVMQNAKDRYATAIENGKKGGRPKEAQSDKINELKQTGLTNKEVAEQLGCSTRTVERANRQNRQNLSVSVSSSESVSESLSSSVNDSSSVNEDSSVSSSGSIDVYKEEEEELKWSEEDLKEEEEPKGLIEEEDLEDLWLEEEEPKEVWGSTNDMPESLRMLQPKRSVEELSMDELQHLVDDYRKEVPYKTLQARYNLNHKLDKMIMGACMTRLMNAK